jgi:hypothetical protein
MALTHVRLYEALKPTVGEEAAGLMAEVIPPAENLATIPYIDAKIAEVSTEIAQVRGEMREGFAAVRGEMHAETSRMLRWMLAFFIPAWAGTWATVVAVVLKG